MIDALNPNIIRRFFMEGEIIAQENLLMEFNYFGLILQKGTMYEFVGFIADPRE